jgi:hypothetical protein
MFPRSRAAAAEDRCIAPRTDGRGPIGFTTKSALVIARRFSIAKRMKDVGPEPSGCTELYRSPVAGDPD